MIHPNPTLQKLTRAYLEEIDNTSYQIGEETVLNQEQQMTTTQYKLTNNPPNTNNTSNELNDENTDDPSPVCTCSGRQATLPIQYNNYVIS